MTDKNLCEIVVHKMENNILIKCKLSELKIGDLYTESLDDKDATPSGFYRRATSDPVYTESKYGHGWCIESKEIP